MKGLVLDQSLQEILDDEEGSTQAALNDAEAAQESDSDVEVTSIIPAPLNPVDVADVGFRAKLYPSYQCKKYRQAFDQEFPGLRKQMAVQRKGKGKGKGKGGYGGKGKCYRKGKGKGKTKARPVFINLDPEDEPGEAEDKAEGGLAVPGETIAAAAPVPAANPAALPAAPAAVEAPPAVQVGAGPAEAMQPPEVEAAQPAPMEAVQGEQAGAGQASSAADALPAGKIVKDWPAFHKQWLADNAKKLNNHPKECLPQVARHGAYSWTVKAPNGACIEVFLNGSFRMKKVGGQPPKPVEGNPAISSIGRTVADAWADAKAGTGFQL